MKRLIAVLFAALALSVGMATAQDQYPSRPVKVIVPYAPGGATDIVARIVGDAFQKVTGQPFVVLNKPGAFGMLAIDEMVKAAPDGYTVMIGNVSTNAITPIIYANKMNFDYAKSVVAVTNLIDVPAFLLVTTANDFPVKSFAEFVAYAKQNPGKVSYGTVGIGSYPHYDMAYFAKRAGDLDLVALPNKNGAAGVIQDMLRGDVQAAFLNVASSRGTDTGRKIPPIGRGQSVAAQRISRHSDHERSRISRRRHGGLEWLVRTGSNAEAGAGSVVCGGEQNSELARGDREA